MLITSAMKRPVDVVQNKLKLLISQTGTIENLEQRQRFSRVRNYLTDKMEEMEDMVISKDKVGYDLKIKSHKTSHWTELAQRY